MGKLRIERIKPVFTQVLTTCEVYGREGLVMEHMEGSVKEWQRVLAVGGAVRGIEPGDMVIVSPEAYIKRQYDANSLQNDIGNNKTVRVDMPVYETVSGRVMLIDQSDVKLVFEGEEEPDSGIVVPEEKKIILP